MDKYDEKAAALVSHCRYCDQTIVNMAAEIAALKAEIERLRIENASLTTAQPGAEQNYYFMLQGAKQEIAKLKAQLAITETANGQLTADLMGCRDGALVRDLRAQLAEAEKRGMERAISLVGETAEFYFGIEHQALLNAIANIRAAMEGE